MNEKLILGPLLYVLLVHTAWFLSEMWAGAFSVFDVFEPH